MEPRARARLKKWGVHGVVAAAAFAFGAILAPGGKAGPPPEMERQTLDLSGLTSPFLECSGELNADLGLVRARGAALAYIREAKAADSTLTVALYARDLNNGPWIGIDEEEPFIPASLSKVPIMIYLLTRAEQDRSILDREVVFPGAEGMSEEDSMEGAPEAMRLQAGQSYTYSDLLHRMIAFSDNFSKELLMTGITPADVDRLMHTIHAEESLVNGRYVVNPRAYSALFRVLYNATFLGRPMSEYALSLLTDSYFRRGLRRFIPEDVVIASKFGNHESLGPSGEELELHECGIVYQPGSPYVFCVMTRTTQSSPDRLAEIIANLSRIVWEEKGG